MASFPGQPS